MFVLLRSPMLRAFALAFAQLPEPELRRPLLMTIFWTLLGFALFWAGVIKELAGIGTTGDWLMLIERGLGALALVLFTWLLFVAVENAILFCYADRIATAVERRHYPRLPPAAAISFVDGARSGLRLVLQAGLGNLLVLPLYLLVPPAIPVCFLILNGYLLGRACFDAVVLRRMDDRSARRLWRDCRLDFTLAGAAGVALIAIPLVNLIVPIVGLAVSVHLVERHRPPVGRLVLP